jgi:putative transposase
MLFNSENNLPTGKNLRELWKNPVRPKKPLVDILSYTLMDNHYHLVLEQLVDRGIEHFMHKLSTGYTKYFNARSTNRGVIFESRYKAVHIKTDEQFIHITRYVHLNPYDHHDYAWRDGKARSKDAVDQILQAYQWSSCRHYFGLENNPLVKADRILACFDGSQDYKNFVLSWTTRSSEIISGLMIDDSLQHSV